MVSLRSFTGIKGTEWEKLGILIEKFVTRYKIQGTRYKEGQKSSVKKQGKKRRNKIKLIVFSQGKHVGGN